MCDLKTEMKLRLAALRETFPDREFTLTASKDGVATTISGEQAENRTGKTRDCRPNPESVKQNVAPALQTQTLATLIKALTSACAALRSYQWGNSSTELAKSIADHCDEVLKPYRAPAPAGDA